MEDITNLSDEEIQKELRLRKYRKQIDALAVRYGDAYLVARTVTSFGSTIKGFGVLIGIIFAIGGFMAANKSGPGGEGALVGILAIGLGIVVAALFYVTGVLVSSQGQILKASLDGAVNSSPFLENEHKSKIMSLD